jgi:tetratricopeptide (TPR) repeat protein
MSDSLTEVKFIKSVGLALEDHALIFTHDYGEVTLPWDSITHAFLIIWDKKMTSGLPLFVMYSNTSDYFYYIDGNTMSIKSLKMGDAPEDSSQSQELADVKKSKEEGFRKVVQEICTRSRARFDKTVNPYLKGLQVMIPKFVRLKEISDYCIQTMSTMEDGQFIDEPMASSPVVARSQGKLAPGTVIEGKYAIKEVIASETETHYVVFDPDGQKFFALKTLPENYLNDTTMTNLFINQAVMWTRQGAHHNLVKAELFKIIDNIPYIFTEYIHGQDLESLTKTESLSVKSTMEIGIQLCEGLDFGFKQSGTAHRDIRPSNCIITAEHVLKITGFGLAKIFDDIPCKGPMSDRCKKVDNKEIAPRDFPLYKSLPYMAPELFANTDAAGIKTDIYSFGVLMYKLLTAVNPFSGDTSSKIFSNHLTLTPANPVKLNPKVPEPLGKLVLKCIEKDPALRYEHFSQISAELKQIYQKSTGFPFDKPKIEKAMSVDYWINKGLSLRSINRNDEANKAFDEALKTDHESLRAKFYRGSSLNKRLSEGMRDEPGNWEAWFWKGESFRRTGRTDEALKCFDKALSLNEKEEMLWVQVGRLMIELGKMDNALKSYDKALSHNPRAADILDYKGNLLLQMKDNQAASDCFKEALDLNPSYKWAMHHQGMALFNLGSYDEAIIVLKKVLDLDPHFYNAWIRIGDCYSQQGKTADALNAYEQAIGLDAKNKDAYLACVQTLKKTEEWEQVLLWIDRALAVDPTEPSLAYDMADALGKLSYYKESQTICQKILTEDPQNYDWQLLLNGVSRLEKAQGTLIERIFSNASVPRESFNNDLNGLLSVFCSAKGAVAYMEISSLDDARTSYLKACLYFIEGAYEKALEHSSKALEDPHVGESAQRIRKRSEESLEKTSKVKELLQFAKMLKRKEIESDDELVINGLEKMKNNKFHEARSHFRDILTKNPAMYSCIYFMAKNYEQENNIEKAQHYIGEFTKYVPLSIGINKERMMLCRESDPGEVEEIHQKLIGSYPYNCLLWLDYFKFLSEKNDDERLRLLMSGLLRISFSEWDHLRESSLFWSIFGFMQVYLGRHKDAQKSCERAIQYGGGNSTSFQEICAYLEGSALFGNALDCIKTMIPASGG